MADGAGAPKDAGDELLDELKDAAKKIKEPEADPKVVAAVKLGWLMADMLAPRVSLDPDGKELPQAISDKNQQLRLDQLVGDLAIPDDIVPKDVAARATTWPDDLQAWLLATDARFARGFDLGRRLCDLRRKAFDWKLLATELPPLTLRLDSLRSALPPHAGRGVSISALRWASLLPSASETEDADERQRLEKVKAQAPAVFGAQCEIWRQLVTGDKQATDMLEPENYLDAADRLAGKYVATVRLALEKNWRLAAIAGVLALAGLVLLGLVAFVGDGDGDGSGLVAGLTALLGAAGLTWKGLGGAVGKLAGRLEGPLWAAELDGAVAEAATLIQVKTPETSSHDVRKNLSGGDYAGRRLIVTGQMPVGDASPAGTPEPPAPAGGPPPSGAARAS